MTVVQTSGQETWSLTITGALRRLSAVTWAGALAGLLVGGVGSRLAMLLLARLNPRATGMTSDDGFVIGHLTPDSLNLLFVTTLLGVFGGGVYLVLRGLMIGPRWFQVLSISLGPAVVVGSSLVHVDGVDFTLDPVWLAIAMFVAIPGAYAALLTVLADRWLAPGGRFLDSPFWVACLPLLLWAPILPFLGALLLGLLLFESVRRTAKGRAVLGHPAGPWLVRGALAVLFTVSLVELARDTVALT